MVVGVAVLVAWSYISLPLGARAAATPSRVMIVLMENTSYEGIVGNSQMPYVNGLVASNGSVSTTDLSHPSLPNYLGLVSGSIQNNPQDTTPQDGTYAGPQFTDELAAAGIGWKAYMQDMPVACDLTDQYGPGSYDVNHNPFMYFNSVRNTPSQCSRDVPYPQLTSDLNAGTAPPFLWVTPNTINDMHDGTPAQGDSFLRGLVTQVQASSWWTAGSRIIITWDEGTQSEQVLTLVVGSTHGTQAAGGNAYGTLRGIEEAYGVGLLGHSADANVGDIRPLLASSTPPPPSSPSPSPHPAQTVSPKPPPASPSALQSSSPAPSMTPGPQPYVRGVYGKDSSPSGSALIAAAGFNTVMTDPYKELLEPLAAKGLKGIVWMGAWENAPTCGFERDDATITSQVASIAGNPAILAYYLGDEPRVSECPDAPAMFK
ncbi:MAG: alkaline phosphatase family protein, partial [Terriglobales bacterium]